MATKLSGYKCLLFGPNYLIKRSIKYFFWPISNMKKITVTTKSSVNSESLRTSDLGVLETDVVLPLSTKCIWHTKLE